MRAESGFSTEADYGESVRGPSAELCPLTPVVGGQWQSSLKLKLFVHFYTKERPKRKTHLNETIQSI